MIMLAESTKVTAPEW